VRYRDFGGAQGCRVPRQQSLIFQPKHGNPLVKRAWAVCSLQHELSSMTALDMSNNLSLLPFFTKVCLWRRMVPSLTEMQILGQPQNDILIL